MKIIQELSPESKINLRNIELVRKMSEKVKKVREDKIIQFRASGVRVKLPTFSPALNLVGTQIPIFPWVHVPDSKKKGRYMTVKEAAKIQGMEDLRFENEHFHMSDTRCFEALGNAVNVEIVSNIAKDLIEFVNG